MFTISTFDTDWILVHAARGRRGRGGPGRGRPHRAPARPARRHRRTTHERHRPPGLPGRRGRRRSEGSGGKDLALVVSDGPEYTSASVFTANRCKANPVLWSQEVVKDGTVRAVVLNSGGANCYTGADGFRTTHAVAEQVASGLGIGAIDVVVCSTGLIGLANPRDVLLAGVDAALADLSAGRRRRRRRGDHDHGLGQQAGRRRGQRLEHRRDGQGRRHARAPARHDARRPHHRRRGLPGRRRPGPAAGDPGRASTGWTPTAACRPTTPSPCWPTAPPASPLRSRTSPRRCPGPAPTWRCSCSPTPRAPTTRSRSPC